MSLHDKVLCCKFCMLINIICIKIQIIHCKYTVYSYAHFTEKCTYWIKCWNMITYSFIGSLSSKGPTFSKNLYMLTWRTCRLRRLEIKMSLSVIHCMSSDSIWEWTAGTSTQQIHSSGVVIEEQLPHSHLKNKIHYLHIKQA